MDGLERIVVEAIEQGKPIPVTFNSKHVLTIDLVGALAASDFILHKLIPFNGTLVEAYASYSGAATGTASFVIAKSDPDSSPTAGTAMTEGLDVSEPSNQYAVRQIPIVLAERSVTKGQLLGLVDTGAVAGLDNLVVTMVFDVTDFG